MENFNNSTKRRNLGKLRTNALFVLSTLSLATLIGISIPSVWRDSVRKDVAKCLNTDGEEINPDAIEKCEENLGAINQAQIAIQDFHLNHDGMTRLKFRDQLAKCLESVDGELTLASMQKCDGPIHRFGDEMFEYLGMQ